MNTDCTADTRVMVTGLGCVTAAGVGRDLFWESLRAGKSHINRIASFDSSRYPTRIAAEASSFDASHYLSPKLLRRTGRATHFAVSAATQALQDSRLEVSRIDTTSLGVFVGVSSPQLDIGESAYAALLEGGLHRFPPTALGAFFPNATAGVLCSIFGIKGPSLTISTGCSAGSNALGQAFKSLRNNEIRYALVVGADALITPMGLASFCALRRMSTRNESPETACRPFDLERDGFVLGEGSAALLLESHRSAKERNARIYCSILGYGCTSSPDDLIFVDDRGTSLSTAMELSLNQANVNMKEISFINAHGCGSKLLDELESISIRKLFDLEHCEPHVFSVKSCIGHPLAATGPLQVVTTALCFEASSVPPVINYSKPDPACNIRVIRHSPIALGPSSVALVNDFGYGGNNVSIVLQSANTV